MKYTKRNNQSTTHLAETPTVLAQLYRLQAQLSCIDKAERLCHELLAALTHALQNEPPQHLSNRIRRHGMACYSVQGLKSFAGMICGIILLLCWLWQVWI